MQQPHREQLMATSWPVIMVGLPGTSNCYQPLILRLWESGANENGQIATFLHEFTEPEEKPHPAKDTKALKIAKEAVITSEERAMGDRAPPFFQTVYVAFRSPSN